MKPYVFILVSILAMITASCIRDEPLYREADIESFSLDDDLMINVVISQCSIQIIVSDTTNIGLHTFTPRITVSPGATVTPSSGDQIRFANYLSTFQVTSEDGTVVKLYTAEISQIARLKFDFENWTAKSLGAKTYPALNDALWSNANAGLAIAVPSDYVYPTRPTEKGGGYNSDYAALLETKEGVKVLGIGANIVAGSLFMGKFMLTTPLTESVKFGQAHPQSAGKPVKMTGYYKYKPGQVCIDKNNNVLSQTDQCAIYAIFFKVTKGDEGQSEFLTGSVVNTSDKLIARANVANLSGVDEFTYFSADFVYREEPDYDKYDYKLGIVFSSSKNGDLEEGAVGSTLVVDEIEIVTEYTDR